MSIKLIKKDPFGNFILFKRVLITFLAMVTYGRFNIINKLKIRGTEHLKGLPNTNVMFVANHQTYYAEVMAMYHVFCSVKWNFRNTIDLPFYILSPRHNTYYIAAEETMKNSGFIPRLFAYAGAITVKRAWRSNGQDVKRGADVKAPDKIKKALDNGWVVNFPQGTTTPFAPVRKGTASLIKSYNPIVIPVVIDGFQTAFDKKGLQIIKRGTTLRITFKAPMVFEENEPVDSIMQKVAAAIEQDAISQSKQALS